MSNSAKPTALKLVTGNPGKRAINKNEPKPTVGTPKMPSHLPPKAKTYWKDVSKLLSEMGVLTVADGKALEQLCNTYCEWRDHLKDIQRDGTTYWAETQSGKLLKANPSVAMASDAQKRIKSFMVEFGLTPSSRTRIKAETPTTVDPLEEYLGRK